MIEPRDLFEAHLTVTDLDEGIQFYRDVLGLRLAHVPKTRHAAFFWIGSSGKAMLGLWAGGSSPLKIVSHVAFRVGVAEVLAAPVALRSAGITPLGFDGEPTDLPDVLSWMPAAAVYFRDPAGNLLEYIAMLPHKPCSECGVLPWRMWELTRHDTVSV
jgi:lactoylglutathione lyase